MSNTNPPQNGVNPDAREVPVSYKSPIMLLNSRSQEMFEIPTH
jgi:hypothetical protein